MTQKEGVKQAVEDFVERGIPVRETLCQVGIARSSYYRWMSKWKVQEEATSDHIVRGVPELRPEEAQAIIRRKEKEPHLSHRQISGLLRQEGLWVSESSCYRLLKDKNLVEPREVRPAPWNQAAYEPFRPNQSWGLDWTQLRVAGLRRYLVTVIDFFSRYLLAWAIVRTVTQEEVTALVTLALLDQKLEEVPERLRPRLRVDRGSANTSSVTKEVLQELAMELSYSRVARPTDNARQERFYRTIKQEEIYVVLDYPSDDGARDNIGRYMQYYNDKRPNQALWNATPAEVHRIGNKTQLLERMRERKINARNERRLYWESMNNNPGSNQLNISENMS